MTVTHSSPACFVTGTDTEIGKTLVTSALLHFLGQQGLRTVGMKPVAAGAELVDGVLCNEDVDALAACSSEQPPLEMRTPYLLRTAAAPHIAAELEGVRIDAEVIVARFQRLRALADACVVEGVGGFRVPLNDDEDTADLAVRLGLPVVMVVGLRLGCINQALLTQEAIAARGLRLIGWVANCCSADMAFADENVAAIRRRIAAPLLGVVPRVAGADAAQRARHAADHLDAEALFRVFALSRS